MTYYSQRGYSDPGQYFVQKQQQRSQMLPQLLQMMMMFREMKEKKGQRKWERGIEEQKLDISRGRAETYAESVKPTPEKPPEGIRTLQYMVRLGLAENIEDAWKKKEHFGKLSLQDKLKEHEEKKKIDSRYISPTDQDKRFKAIDKLPISEDDRLRLKAGVTEISATTRVTQRRLVEDNIKKRFLTIQTNDPNAFTDTKKIDTYRKRAGVHLDLPVEYNMALAHSKMKLAEPEELQYIDKVNITKQWFDKHKAEKEFELDTILDDPMIKSKLDVPTLEMLFSVHKKRKKILGLF